MLLIALLIVSAYSANFVFRIYEGSGCDDAKVWAYLSWNVASALAGSAFSQTADPTCYQWSNFGFSYSLRFNCDAGTNVITVGGYMGDDCTGSGYTVSFPTQTLGTACTDVGGLHSFKFSCDEGIPKEYAHLTLYKPGLSACGKLPSNFLLDVYFKVGQCINAGWFPSTYVGTGRVLPGSYKVVAAGTEGVEVDIYPIGDTTCQSVTPVKFKWTGPGCQSTPTTRRGAEAEGAIKFVGFGDDSGKAGLVISFLVATVVALLF